MKLVSMKRKDGHGNGCSCCDSAPSGCDEPDYPWGLRLQLTEDQLKALGVESLPASGAPVAIEATATVVGMSEEQLDGETRRRLDLQITDMALAAAGAGKFSRMYAADQSMKD